MSVLRVAAPVQVGESGQVTNDIFWDPYEDESSTTQQISTVLVVGPTGQSPAVPLPGTGLLPEPIFGAGTAPSAGALVCLVTQATAYRKRSAFGLG